MFHCRHADWIALINRFSWDQSAAAALLKISEVIVLEVRTQPGPVPDVAVGRGKSRSKITIQVAVQSFDRSGIAAATVTGWVDGAKGAI